MATEKRKTTVIIAGSGLTGLALALMLQDLGVDYLLLEAYDSCTPNVGASIAIQPQGLRILDQLGLLEDIEAIYQPVGQLISCDADTGKLHILETTEILKERHGYDVGFFNRYDLLCVLHKHIREKERLLVNQKVARVDTYEDKVVVQTSTGDVFEAQMIVGADGVRSTVREEMWRNAEVAGAVPEEDKKGQWDTFWFFKLPEENRKITHNGIPRFTKEDHEREITRAKKLLAKVPRKNGLHLDFDQLYDQRDPEHCGITALPHFVLKKWHFGRIVVIGDSSHKFNPLPGHGGMNCLVSATTLVNCLQDALGDKIKSSPVWDMAPLDDAFTKLAEARVDKVKSAVDASEDAVNMMGWSSSYQKIRYKVLLPLLPNSAHADGNTKVIRTGHALKGWKVPEVPHTVKYEDEEMSVKKERSAILSPATLLLTATAAAVGGIMVMRALQKHPELLVNGWKTLQSTAV
ncbi:hypothetical protein SLS64_010982 [Diaporthe eres]